MGAVRTQKKRAQSTHPKNSLVLITDRMVTNCPMKFNRIIAETWEKVKKCRIAAHGRIDINPLRDFRYFPSGIDMPSARYALQGERGFISYGVAKQHIDFAVRQKYRMAKPYIDKNSECRMPNAGCRMPNAGCRIAGRRGRRPLQEYR